MPHNGLYNGVVSLLEDMGTTVVESVTGTCLLLAQPATPQRCGAALSCPYVVGHMQLVLYKIGIGPYRLVVVAHHLSTRLFHVFPRHRIGPAVIFLNGPRRPVAGRATHLVEEFLSALHFLAV